MTRREFVASSASGLAASLVPSEFFDSAWVAGSRIPEESEPHECSWLAYAHSAAIWEDLLPGVRSDQVRLANAISEFEPVVLLARKSDLAAVKRMVSKEVEVMEADFNDLWIRDFGPQFMIGTSGKLEAIDLRFNGWGGKQVHSLDRKVAQFVANELDIPIKPSKVVIEGGAVEVDGKGTMIVTKSCVVNKNRNPNRTLAQIEADLKAQFNLKRIVWLDGIAGKDMTDGHTDFYARFLPSGHVLANFEKDPDSFDYAVTRKHIEQLRKVFGSAKLKTVSPPMTLPTGFEDEDFAAGYINYYVVNGAVIVPKFGDGSADEKAQSMIEASYPGREVVPVSINSIAAGGGGIHCATLHQPKAR